jgi:hypothetical protein
VRLAAILLGLTLIAAACSSGPAAPSPTPEPEVGPAEPITPRPPRGIVLDPDDPEPLIDVGELVRGGPPPDGIPPIDDPVFEPAAEDVLLAADEPVIALEIGDDARAYPAQILIWHEIVNDLVGGVPVAVTYCPLCNTAIVFRRPLVDGQLLDFGTSGLLYRSNLVMYDRQTDSLWPQALGQAVVGELTGIELDLVPAQLVSFGDFLRMHPDGQVLTRDTGVERRYGTNPYTGYDRPDSAPFLFDGELDDRLPPKARVVGLRFGRAVLAVPYDELIEGRVGDHAAASVRVGQRDVVVFWQAGTASAIDAALVERSRDVGATGTFDPRLDGRRLAFRATADGIVDEQTGSRWNIFGVATHGPLAGEGLRRLVAIESLWFDWAALFPRTQIWRR